jgi:Ca-activated chloride channel family protein
MSFLNPEFFWFLLLLFPIFIKKDFREFRLTVYGYTLTFILIVIALSRPVVEQEPVKSKQVLSDVVVCVDLSYSMHADDIQPTRLKKAKETLKELVMSENKTRFGVLGFTTNAIVLSPLTQDRELLLHLYNSLDERFVITKGSSVMPALKLARKMSHSKNLSVVLLTDGADELEYSSEAKFAKQNNMTINILMLASSMGGTLTLANGELLQDEIGDIVVSRENEAIQEISDVSSGVYTKDFDELLDALRDQSQKDKEVETTIVQNLELFYYFVFLAIITFLVSITTLKKYVLAFLVLFGVNLQADKYSDAFNEATKLYRVGSYEKALGKFESVKSSHVEFKSVVYYNIGNTYVRLQQFKKARVAYLKSLTLLYTKEADENLHYIEDAGDKKQMSTGQQKTDNKSSMAKKMKNSKEQKEGGGSNMKVKAPAGSGDSQGKKTKTQASINLNSSKAKLSSKQYELINKRRVNEKQPW